MVNEHTTPVSKQVEPMIFYAFVKIHNKLHCSHLINELQSYLFSRCVIILMWWSVIPCGCRRVTVWVVIGGAASSLCWLAAGSIWLSAGVSRCVRLLLLFTLLSRAYRATNLSLSKRKLNVSQRAQQRKLNITMLSLGVQWKVPV